MNVHFEGCPASGGDPCTCASVLGVSKTRLLPDAVAFLDQIVKAIEDGPAHPRLTDAVVMVAALRRRLQNESAQALEAPALPQEGSRDR